MKTLVPAVIVLLVAIGGVVIAYQMQPPRLTAKHLAAALQVEEELIEAAEIETGLDASRAAEEAHDHDHDHDHDHAHDDGHDHDHDHTETAGGAAAAAAATGETEDDVFYVKLAASTGDILIEVHPSWAPLGAARFREMVEEGLLDEARFFRVVPGFVVQFGIPGDPRVASEWQNKRILDEPVIQSNVEGTLTFAKSAMPNSRTTQLFINLGNNTRLDNDGFSAFGRVVSGMEHVRAITSEYGEQPNQQLIQMQGNKYLNDQFPNLDYVKTATIVEGPAASEGESADPAE